MQTTADSSARAEQILRNLPRINGIVPMYVDGRWTLAADGATRELINPADGRPDRGRRRGRRGRRRGGDRGGAQGVRRRPVARHERGRPRGAALPRRRRDRREPRRVHAHRHAQQRQAAARDGIRRDRRGELLPLLRRPRDQAARPDVRRARAVANLHGARADRRVRPDRPVELPAPHGGMEARAGLGGGQRLRAQAGGADAALDDPPGDDLRRARVSAGRRQRRARPGSHRSVTRSQRACSSTRSRSRAERRRVAASCKPRRRTSRRSRSSWAASRPTSCSPTPISTRRSTTRSSASSPTRGRCARRVRG